MSYNDNVNKRWRPKTQELNMQLRDKTFNEIEKQNEIRLLDGCICRICVSNDPLEITRMIGFASHHIGMLAQNRLLQIKENEGE